MANVWIGRKLTGASDALTARYLELTLQAGDASLLVASLAPSLLREIGRCLTRGEQDPRTDRAGDDLPQLENSHALECIGHGCSLWHVPVKLRVAGQ